MVDQLRRMTWEDLSRLTDAFLATWREMPHRGMSRGRLPTEPDDQTVPEAIELRNQAESVVQFYRIPEIEPRLDSTYAWVDAGWAPTLWAVSNAVFGVASRSLLLDEDYELLTAPWRVTFERQVDGASREPS